MQNQHVRNAKNVLLVAALAVTLGACTTIETRYITPDCEVPPRPTLPVLDAGEQWDYFVDAHLWRGLDEMEAVVAGDRAYRLIEERDARITDWALELEAGMQELCSE